MISHVNLNNREELKKTDNSFNKKMTKVAAGLL